MTKPPTLDRLVQIRVRGKHCALTCPCLLSVPGEGKSLDVCGIGDVLLDRDHTTGQRLRTDECLALTEEEPT